MHRALTILAFVCFATSLFVRPADPVIPQIAVGLMVDTATAALLSTAFSLPYAITQPLLGALADMLGKVRLMMASLLILVLAGFAGALAANFSLLFVTRVLAGCASGGIFPIALAMAGDLVPINRRQVAISRILAASMTGNLLGASMGGLIGDLVGWRGVFVATALIGAVVFAAALFGFRRVALREAPRVDLATTGRNFRTIFTNPLAKICFGAVFLEGIFLFGVFPYMATFLHARGETRASIAGLVIAGFGVGGVCYTFVIATLLRRLGERPLMIGGGAVMALGLIVVASGAPWQIQLVNFVGLGLGFYLLHGCIQIYVTELAPKARALALALHSCAFFLGQGIGPIVYGASFTWIGKMPSLAFGAVVLITVGLVCARWLRRPDEEEAV
ncbi:MAG: MFS transporter [Xanthobacteraceae bacterium]